VTRSFRISLLTGVLGCAVLVSQAGAADPIVLEKQKDQVSYAMGVNFVSNLKQQGIEVDLDLLIRGMKDAASGGKLLITDEEVRKAIYLYQTELRRKHEQARTKATSGGKKEVGKAPVAK